MSKANAKTAWKKSCVARHLFVFLDDTLRGLLISLKGGGLIGGVQYPAAPLHGLLATRVEKQIAEVKRWLNPCLHQVGIDARTGGYQLSERERGLINRKIVRVNRWTMEENVETWRSMVLNLAAFNLCLFWARMMLGDEPCRRMVFLEADNLCLMLGDAADWLLAADMFDFCKDVLLDGMPWGGLKSEEEYFFRFLAMPTPRSSMERALFEENNRLPDVTALLSA